MGERKTALGRYKTLRLSFRSQASTGVVSMGMISPEWVPCMCIQAVSPSHWRDGPYYRLSDTREPSNSSRVISLFQTRTKDTFWQFRREKSRFIWWSCFGHFSSWTAALNRKTIVYYMYKHTVCCLWFVTNHFWLLLLIEHKVKWKPQTEL